MRGKDNDVVVLHPDQLKSMIRRHVEDATEGLRETVRQLTDHMWMHKNVLNHYEAATYTGLKHETICRYCREGKIKAEKRGHTWFMRRAALERFLTAENGVD